MSTLEGTTLGRYHLTRLLGRGGMAEVYLASDDQLHREVAVKVVHLSREEGIARFRQEAELLGLLTHEHILSVFDVGVQGPWHYFVMPYLSSGTLRQRLHSQGPLSPKQAGLLLEQIASALHYAHERGILHRDIKASNILLRDDTFAYVADFGLAKVLSEAREWTQTGVVVGTPEYLAPELLEEQASPGSEVYALGVLLYDMLTGQLPFTGLTTQAILLKHVSTPPLPPSQRNPAISLPVEQVVLAALEKDPARRFPTPQALAQAYRQALEEASRPRGRRGGGFFGRRDMAAPPQALLIGGVLGVLLLLAVAFWLNTTLRGGSLPAAAPTPVIQVAAIPSPTARSSPTAKSSSAVTASPTVKPSPTMTASPTTTPSPTATSTPCVVTDDAHILDRVQVCQAGQTLSSPLTVYSTKTFAQGDGDFDRLSASLVTSPKMIVIAINVKPSPKPGPAHVHVSIVGGISVPLTNPQYHQAIDAFTHAATTGTYTVATIEAIQTLHSEGA